MHSIHEKGGASFKGIKLLLCEDPLPPIDEAIAAAQAEVPGNKTTSRAIARSTRRVAQLIAAGINGPPHP